MGANTTVKVIAEKFPGPVKMGRVYFQTSSLEPNFMLMLAEIEQRVQREYSEGGTKTYVRMGYRYERVEDGAGVSHFNLYAYFDPADGMVDDRDPSNLNNAPVVVLGQTVQQDILDIGSKERKF